jgi:hypothetical protein
MKHMFQPGDARWLVLILRVPPRPSSLRVRAWRRLRALGAVALKGSVYLLPLGPDHLEQLQWLAQEVQGRAGEATLFQVDRVENLPTQDIVGLFHEARERDYRVLAERYRRLLRAGEPRRRRGLPARAREELGRLGRELDRVQRIDFFGAPGASEVTRLREACEARLAPPPSPGEGGTLQGLRGCCWVTRPRPHIDRIATAWLLARYVDPEGQVLFAPPDRFPPDALPFDAPGAELGHHGEDCTFETVLRRTGLADPALGVLAEIVHEADLGDGKFQRPEAPGVDLAVRGLLARHADDHEVLAHGLVLFDALHAALESQTGGKA